MTQKSVDGAEAARSKLCKKGRPVRQCQIRRPVKAPKVKPAKKQTQPVMPKKSRRSSSKKAMPAATVSKPDMEDNAETPAIMKKPAATSVKKPAMGDPATTGAGLARSLHGKSGRARQSKGCWLTLPLMTDNELLK